MSKQRRIVVLAVLLLLLLGGVSGNAGPSRQESLVLALDGLVVNLDPSVRESYADYDTYVNIYDPLFRRDNDMVLRPHLATSLRRINDVTWEVKLRRGVRFHNGEPFDASSVKFTVDRIKDPKLTSDMSFWLTPLQEVKIIDPYTVHLIHSAPYALVDFEVSRIYPLPPKFVQQMGNEKYQRDPVGTGPYKFVSWAKSGDIVLERNEAYWGPKPGFRQVVIRYIPDASTRVAALLSGEIDIAFRVPIEQVAAVNRSSCCAISRALGGRVAQLQLSVTHGHEALKDKRVRQAIAYAIDVQNALLPLQEGLAQRLATTIHPKAFGHDPTIKPWPYDPARARTLLSDAGYPNGIPFTINTVPERKAVAEAAAGQLTKAGIRAQVKVHEPTVFFKGWNDHNLGGDAFMLGLISQNWDADGMFYLRFHSTGQYTYFSNSRTDRWLEEGRKALDPARRRAIYREMQQYLFQHPGGEIPIIPFFAESVVMGVSKKVRYQVRSDEYTFLDQARPAR
jgi:peptide/nickel transport system substrate-binding protein